MYLYQDRQDAGSELAHLISNAEIKDPLLFALSAGGVLVACVMSHEIGIPFQILVTEKIGAIGAMTEDGHAFLVKEMNYADPRILEVIKDQRQELRRRVSLYREGQHLPDVNQRNVIIVDDGLADEASTLAAAKFLKNRGASKVILAVPVAPRYPEIDLKRFIDDIICPHYSEGLHTVGEWYQDYSDVTDKQVVELLQSQRV
jgi:putative phosphoribosyl transferase